MLDLLPPPDLPGGGVLRVLWSNETMRVVEQRLPDGRLFRWLLQTPLVQTVVALGGGASRPRTRLDPDSFDRSVLMPAYHVAMVAALGLRRGASRTFLFLGVGGGSLPAYLRQHHPRVQMTGVDSSAVALELGRRFFGCTAGPRLSLHAQRAEDFLARRRASSWDAILLDVSASDESTPPAAPLVAPPASLCSARALRGLRSRLRPGGVLVINCLGAAAALKQLTARLARAFECDGGGSGGVVAISTSEGNLVLAAVRREARCTACASVGDARWREVCASLGLSVRQVCGGAK
jgi:SAM-dependent methyltransferase